MAETPTYSADEVEIAPSYSADDVEFAPASAAPAGPPPATLNRPRPGFSGTMPPARTHLVQTSPYMPGAPPRFEEMGVGPTPASELTTEAAQRGSQTGAVLGGLLTAPVTTAVGLGASYLTGKGAKRIAKAAGASPETQAKAEEAGTMAPMLAAPFIGMARPQFAADIAPEGTRAAGTLFGGKAGAGVAVTPEAVTVRGKVGPFEGTKTFTRTPKASAAPALEPPTIQGEISRAEIAEAQEATNYAGPKETEAYIQQKRAAAAPPPAAAAPEGAATTSAAAPPPKPAARTPKARPAHTPSPQAEPRAAEAIPEYKASEVELASTTAVPQAPTPKSRQEAARTPALPRTEQAVPERAGGVRDAGAAVPAGPAADTGKGAPALQKGQAVTLPDGRRAKVEYSAPADKLPVVRLKAEDGETVKLTSAKEIAQLQPATKYKYGSTQANIPANSEAHTALESARQRIAQGDLAGQGKDVGGNHVTVRYGIKSEDVEGVKKYLASLAPFEASLGKTDKFPPTDHSDGAAVIHAPIESPELQKINAELEQHGDFTEPSFKEFRPHATIAYVKPEKASRYVGMSLTEGKKFPVNEIAITDKEGNQQVVKLEGKAAPETKAPVAETIAPKGETKRTNAIEKVKTLTLAGKHDEAQKFIPHTTAHDQEPAAIRGKETHEVYRKDGEWNRERQQLHAKNVRDIVDDKPSQEKPTLIILGGGAASGKSAVTQQALKDFPGAVVVDPDHFKEKTPEYQTFKKTDPFHAAHRVHEESSWQAAEALRQSLAKNNHVILDGVNGKADKIKRIMEEARAKGYRVEVRYIDRDKGEALKGMVQRFDTTGRWVPGKVFEEGHHGAAHSFHEIKELADNSTLHIVDDKGVPALVYENGKVYNQGELDKHLNKGSQYGRTGVQRAGDGSDQPRPEGRRGEQGQPQAAARPETVPASAPYPAETGRLQNRVASLIDRFHEALKTNQLPTNAKDLRELARATVGGNPSEYIDDIYDAVEGATNRRYREAMAAVDNPTRFRDRLQVAKGIEDQVGKRIRSLDIVKLQQFSTPHTISEGAGYAADVQPGERVVEPTAGTGNLIEPVREKAKEIFPVELDPRRVEVLRANGYLPHAGDFLRTPVPKPTEVAVMNPPWGKISTERYKALDVPAPWIGRFGDVSERFFVKAFNDLAPGGRVSAVMPTTILGKSGQGFMRWIGKNGTLRAIIQSPPGAYDNRGTTVDSLLVVVDKAKLADAPAPIMAVESNQPKDWDQYAKAVEPLANGGTHARQPNALAYIQSRAEALPGNRNPARPESPAPRPGPERVPAQRGPGQGALDVRPESVGMGASLVPGADVHESVDSPGADGASLPEPTPAVVRKSPATLRGDLAAKRKLEFKEANHSPVFAPYAVRSGISGNPHPRQVAVVFEHTAASAMKDIEAGDHIPVEHDWMLRMGKAGEKKGKIIIDGAGMMNTDRGKTVMPHGAKYSPVGNFFYLPDEAALNKFLERFPIVKEASAPGEVEEEPESMLASTSGSFTPAALHPQHIRNTWDRIISDFADKKLQIGDKYWRVKAYDPEIADTLHMVDNAPRYFREKAKANLDKALQGLSEGQIRLAHLMVDSDSRDDLAANHPQEYQDALNDAKVMGAVRAYTPLRQELTDDRIALGWPVRKNLHVEEDPTAKNPFVVKNRQGAPVADFKTERQAEAFVEQNGVPEPHLKRTYPEHMRSPLPADVGKGPYTGTFYGDKGLRPPKMDKKSREMSAAYHYEHGAKDFSGYLESYAQTKEAVLKQQLFDTLTATATKWKAGTAQPPKITYNGKEYVRPDIALKARQGKVALEPYAVYDPSRGEKFLIKTPDWSTLSTGKPGIGPNDRWLAPKAVVDALENYDASRGGEGPGKLRKFFQEQIVGLFGPVVHVNNIIRHLGQATGINAVDPRSWPSISRLILSSNLRARMQQGVDDSTIDLLVRRGAYTDWSDIGNMNAYIGGNMNPVNWVRSFGKGVLFDPKFAKGWGGLDPKARVLVADYLKEHVPGISEQKIADTVNDAFGNYNRANWTERQKMIARFTLFPGWDTASAKWVLKHPIGVGIAGAAVVLAINLALHELGKNKDDDWVDFSYIHYGDRKYRSGLISDSMGEHLMAPALSAAQAWLKGEDVASGAEQGVLRGGGGLIGTLRPEIQLVAEQFFNRKFAGSASEIVKPEDKNIPGIVLPNRDLEKRAIFATLKAFPAIQRFIAPDQTLDVKTGVGSIIGVSNYKYGAEERLKANAAKASGYAQTLKQLSETNPDEAEKFVEDPKKAVYLVFHGDFQEMTKALKEVDDQVSQVKMSGDLSQKERKQILESLEDSRDQLLESAEALNEQFSLAKMRKQ